jgi:hypothetical protein
MSVFYGKTGKGDGGVWDGMASQCKKNGGPKGPHSFQRDNIALKQQFQTEYQNPTKTSQHLQTQGSRHNNHSYIAITS